MKRLVVDTDPGVDDALALILAFGDPETRIEALTVVAGNVGLERTVANACTILDVLGISSSATPVFRGCDRSLLGDRVAATSHGADGLGDCHFSPSARPVEAEHAANALVRLANEAPGELTLVSLGPLTNLALALNLDPDLPGKYRRLVVMGGAVRATGNMPRPSTEFNVACDPEAAAVVLNRWPALTLVPWEAAMAHVIGLEHLHELWSASGPRADFVRRITGHRPARAREDFDVAGMFAADPVAMAVALAPGLVTRSERRHVTVELAGRQTRGQTTVDWFGFGGEPPNAEVVLELDRDRFWEMLKASVA
ncbi:MAG TPA: nucleoside hydrolase [Methylomirabilota bacterium]|jgi:purine nucleosidase|nr:nucleoside hydrolase [Methylomirabilota bacterium]